jgi:hypothetical protein
MTSATRPRLALLGVLCTPGIGTGAVLGLDTLTQRAFGSALTTWGFVGGVIGLAAFLSGFVSILAWPAVLVLTRRAVRGDGVSRPIRIVATLACLAATYTAVYFMVWFVILPLGAAR